MPKTRPARFDPHVGHVLGGKIQWFFRTPLPAPLFSLSFLGPPRDAQITLKPGFTTALRIAKGRAYPVPT